MEVELPFMSYTMLQSYNNRSDCVVKLFTLTPFSEEKFTIARTCCTEVDVALQFNHSFGVKS